LELSRLAEALSEGVGDGRPRVPKYLRLSDGIAGAVESGELKPGDRLPGETELAEALPASLGTIQKALASLAEQGVLVRRHGRGTFVAEHQMPPHDLWHFRFLADDGHSLLPIYSHVSTVTRVSEPGPWTTFLKTEDFYVVVDRQIDVNHEFTALARLALPGSRCSGLLEYEPRKLDGVSIRDVMRKQFGLPTQRFSTRVACEPLPEPVAGDVGLVCHILGYGYRDLPVSHQTLYVPPNGRRLEIRDRMG
jgi:GntR family transcriptional regulator